MPSRGHDVQFYHTSEFLCASVARFIAEGLVSGGAGIVVAKPKHLQLVREELKRKRIDVDATLANGTLTLLCAVEARHAIVKQGQVYQEVFHDLVETCLDKNAKFPFTRIYGEIVQVLCEDGEFKANQELEDLWCCLAKRREFHLLCGYKLEGFDSASHRPHFTGVCHCHDKVLPSEEYTELSTLDQQHRMIADLQQQALVLKSEIAHRESLYKELAVEKERAEAAHRAKSTFLANMSHELRTPLTAIIGFADLALDSSSTDHQRVEALQVIHNSGREMTKLIGDLLDVTKIESGSLHTDCTAFCATQVLHDVFELMEVTAHAKDLDLDLHFEKPFPDKIYSDPTRLRQILLNVLGNAIKFTAAGSISAVVRMKPGPDDTAMLECEVKDTGIGLTKEQAGRLFNAFAQADSSISRRFGGTGLGLALSRDLARLLGGDLVIVESIPGKGSTFLLTINAGPIVPLLEHVESVEDNLMFPSSNPGDELASPEPKPIEKLVRAARVMNEEKNDSNKGNKTTLKGKGLRSKYKSSVARPSSRKENDKNFAKTHPCRILVCDDMRLNRTILVRFLSQVGYTSEQVSTAENGLEALGLVEVEDFDLVLMDVAMPVMDGITAAEKIKALYVSGGRVGVCPRLVALTANAMVEERERCLTVMDHFMTKPISFPQLVGEIDKFFTQPAQILAAAPAAITAQNTPATTEVNSSNSNKGKVATATDDESALLSSLFSHQSLDDHYGNSCSDSEGDTSSQCSYQSSNISVPSSSQDSPKHRSPGSINWWTQDELSSVPSSRNVSKSNSPGFPPRTLCPSPTPGQSGASTPPSFTSSSTPGQNGPSASTPPSFTTYNAWVSNPNFSEGMPNRLGSSNGTDSNDNRDKEAGEPDCGEVEDISKRKRLEQMEVVVADPHEAVRIRGRRRGPLSEARRALAPARKWKVIKKTSAASDHPNPLRALLRVTTRTTTTTTNSTYLEVCNSLHHDAQAGVP
eukprot:gb/GEZN01000682.1/.p1 GENE.gb/GEZN01000682.1/~~gb/GEZN01000682.1/.p1  ORF type:complete len:980 (+),score=141.14 gb/GEZN01000682.1/:255-3194(+)